MGSSDRWTDVPPIMEQLKKRAQDLGLWNLFLTHSLYPQGPGLTLRQYADLCELMGRSPRMAPEACNCNAPDTGNMELLIKYASGAQKKRFLEPLLRGETRSAFAMTEPNVASSDATNIETRMDLSEDGREYIINGRKWWISNGGHPKLDFYLVLGKTSGGGRGGASQHRQHSILIVPADAQGIKRVRPMKVFGYDDAVEGHFEITFTHVRVPVENLVLGEGRGFEIIQGRLGPGRIHHCMRAIGMAERALEAMCQRALTRKAFGRRLAEHGTVVFEVAKCRTEIEQARLLVLEAADRIDKVGVKQARLHIAMIKAVVPGMLSRVVDRAMQVHGALGVSQDTFLAQFYAGSRALRYADGPDEVHLMQIGKSELKRVLNSSKL